MAGFALGVGGGGRGIYNASSSGAFEEVPGAIRDYSLLRRVLGLLAPYWQGVAASLFCALGATVLQIANPLVISLAIDAYFLHHRLGRTRFGLRLPADPGHGLVLLSIAYLAGLVLSLGFESVQGYLAQWTGQKAMADLRRKLLAHLHQLAINFYDVTPSGRLVTRLTTDVEALSDLFSNGIVSILANVVMTLFFLAGIVQLNGRLSLVLGAILPLFVVLTTVFRRLITRSQQRVRILLARINSFIAEHVSGITVVHLFNLQEASLATFDKVNHEHMEASQQWVTANAWFLPSIELLGTFSQAGVLIAGSYLLHAGHLTVGTLVAFLQYGTRFLKPIQEISERYGVLQTSLVSAEKVLGLLDVPAPVATGRAWTGPDITSIEFDRVWFAYKPQRWVLEEVSFCVKPGEMLAIVGHTGAGKTTLTNLLLRFYEAQRGTIRLGNVDIGALQPSELRQQFGVVLQDTYVCEGTILENIGFGAEDIDDAQVRWAAQQIGLDEIFRSQPRGLETRVQERGGNLSAGQKQLIALARALAHNPKYFIMDEATSNIDLETEARIRRALGMLLAERTSVVIAHRLSTVLAADHILVMHKGKIVETGNHDTLIAGRGIYWHLFQLQFGHQAQERGLSIPEAGGNGPDESPCVTSRFEGIPNAPESRNG